MSFKNNAFYNLQSRKRLAALLGFPSVADMQKLSESKRNYKVWSIPKKDGSKRWVEKPLPHLMQVHRRIANLLLRLPLPPYAHAARRAHSYVTNANPHTSHTQSACLDIKKFYPSITGRHVFNFFRDTMKCSEDVATVMMRLCTYPARKEAKDHLSTGSPLSPILSLLANIKMFDRIHQDCVAKGLVMTCYYDDVTISGSPLKEADVWLIYRFIETFGLEVHPGKFRIYQPHRAREVTGVVVLKGEKRLPNRRFKAIVVGLRALREGKLDKTGLNSLRGKVIEAHQLAPRQAKTFLKEIDRLTTPSHPQTHHPTANPTTAPLTAQSI